MFVNSKDNYRPWILPQINLYRYQCYYNLHKSTQRSLSATARHLYIYRARGNKYPRNSGYGTGRPNFVAATPCAYHHISVPDDRWDDEYILVDMLHFLSLVWSMAKCIVSPSPIQSIFYQLKQNSGSGIIRPISFLQLINYLD